ncbi:Cyclic nucleotide-binding domain protein [Planctomycetes bacterium CA13]|uniref:Cyclic nucleotide-binding domain protein n=1 Tax=Novipirellula herctigrandis TaxID=2527986 RepID=A0A5C5Z367_9BACT|nr:Cyclic nucleotide-binding domain protein [Planctomycetes bacterium CA13]
MTNLNAKPCNERITAQLKRLPWTKGLSEAAIEDIANAGEYVQLQADDIVHRANEKLTAVFFVVSSRLLATVIDLFGNQVLEKSLTRGSVFGLFSIAQPDQVNTNLVATEPTTGVRLGIEPLLELMSKHPDLQMNLYRLAGDLVRQMAMVDRTKSQPSAIGVVHQSAASRPLTPRLVRRLMQIENTPCVVGDDPNWQPVEGVPYRLLFEKGQLISEQQRQSQLNEWANLGRVFIDLDANQELDHFVRLLSFADTILWCVGPNDVGAALPILKVLLDKVPG